MQHNNISERLNRLEEARAYLKQEFIGLDEVIDSIIHLITPWYTMAELQERPAIVNLWGLSGTGKTDLVQKLMQFLGEGELTYRLEMGQQRYNGLQNTLERIYTGRSGKPMTLILDEFQHVRTINGSGHEAESGELRTVWDLLDHGKMSFYEYMSNGFKLLSLHKQLKYLLGSGVKVKNGAVTHQIELFELCMDDDNNRRMPSFSELADEDEKEPIWFIPRNFWDDLFEQFDREFETIFEFRKHLKTLDGKQAVDLVLAAGRRSFEPTWIDCSKALIFIIGNLDEAYEMTSNTSSDSNATNIRKASEQINVSKIKRSLLERFRAEQVARLGNNHVIYPAFGEAEFMALINKRLEAFRAQIAKLVSVDSTFDETLVRFILREGVTPTQGARPLFSTINSTVDTVVPFLILKKNLLVKNKNQSLRWQVTEDMIQVSQGEKVVHQSQLFSLTEKKRKPKKDEMQAIVGVHEGGHALLQYLLLGEVAPRIVSQSADEDNPGHVDRSELKRIYSKSSIVNELAMLLGGLEAERLVFGDDHITLGSSQDLRNASQLARTAILKSGHGIEAVAQSNSYMLVESHFKVMESAQDQAKAMVKKAQALAAKTLCDHKCALLDLGRYLANHSSMEQAEFEVFLEEHKLTPISKPFAYREHLFNVNNLLLNQNEKINGNGARELLQ